MAIRVRLGSFTAVLRKYGFIKKPECHQPKHLGLTIFTNDEKGWLAVVEQDELYAKANVYIKGDGIEDDDTFLGGSTYFGVRRLDEALYHAEQRLNVKESVKS